ncbi:enoyl-CoA hydratase/carnithine racemase [Antricoccus suffuscus]|uniref:Enoyl-CoA hydratase/carnithine racemase n=1 Tax=Antricoccus suffuscus TaxID=1629062 RepID=A0A2T1A6R4_9ACTN|nr:enoyl-CoA hydratase/isomerase family protein [Antricoccus suffuscus]PRZ44244.1 enoyl-CoA hydratase/carnithine racemase [Antricoccus suffuscus]
MSDQLSVEINDFVAVMEIHGAPNNYFNKSLVSEIAERGFELDNDPNCRAIVLCSEGKHFCAGANFGDDSMEGDRTQTSSELYRAAVRIFEIKTPMIAAVQGSAVGGGLGLACATDFRVASPASRFVANFSLLGFHQGFGLSVSLPEIIGKQKSMDMLYSGRRVGGEEAFAIGLADRLVEDGKQREEAIAWAKQIASAAPLAITSIRETLRDGLAERIRVVLERELDEQSWLWKTKDSQEGVAANLARRTAVFTGE